MSQKSFRNILMVGIVSAGLVACAHGGVPGQAANLDTAAEAAVVDTRVSRFNVAADIAGLGRARQDPIIMLAAARVLSADGIAPVEIEAVEAPISSAEDKPQPGPALTEKAEDGERDLLADIFGEARRFARGDETIIALISETEDTTTKGAVTGAGGWQKRVPARGSIQVTDRFRGGEVAEVGLLGDGDTDVDLYIYDENGREICNSVRNSDRESCRWTPAWTGQFTIKAMNYGWVYNDVVIVTN